jgi:hypothetical protein
LPPYLALDHDDGGDLIEVDVALEALVLVAHRRVLACLYI